jgi:hypothetical protein
MNIFVEKLPERLIHSTRTELALTKPMYLFLRYVYVYAVNLSRFSCCVSIRAVMT